MANWNRTCKTPDEGATFGCYRYIREAPACPRNDRKWIVACLTCGERLERSPYNVRSSPRRCILCASKRSSDMALKTLGSEAALKKWRKRYHSIKSRCGDMGNPYYGGRGVKCLFVDLHDFVSHLVTLKGWDDRGLSVDRINNDGHYERGNLRMATQRMQVHNSGPGAVAFPGEYPRPAKSSE